MTATVEQLSRGLQVSTRRLSSSVCSVKLWFALFAVSNHLTSSALHAGRRRRARTWRAIENIAAGAAEAQGNGAHNIAAARVRSIALRTTSAPFAFDLPAALQVHGWSRESGSRRHEQPPPPAASCQPRRARHQVILTPAYICSRIHACIIRAQSKTLAAAKPPTNPS
jgi:hypothetical protein